MTLPADGVHVRTCPLCEAMCGLEVTVENGRVTRIAPDGDDVWSRGYICPKGAVLGDLHDDPDRLRQPLVRDGGGWRTVGWEEAFRVAEQKLHAVLERHGKQAVATYIGNPTAHNFSLSRYVGPFLAFSGITQIYSAGTVDQWPKNLSSALLFGGIEAGIFNRAAWPQPRQHVIARRIERIGGDVVDHRQLVGAHAEIGRIGKEGDANGDGAEGLTPKQ